MIKSFLLLTLVSCFVARLSRELAKTPQMGWNSWNAFAGSINEQLIKDTADAWIQLKLHQAGYKYLIIDDGFLQYHRDEEGQLAIDKEKFPNGIKAVADYVHSKGLKFGVYSSAGQMTCMGQLGSLGFEEADAELYASLGVDYLKYDNCYGSGLDSLSRFTAMSRALDRVDRDIFYAICNWGQEHTTHWAYLLGHSWRTTGDIKPSWESIMHNLMQNDRAFNPLLQGPYIGWNDPDMLEVGNEGLTDDQNMTHFILWAMVKSPLLLGNDMRKLKKGSRLHWLLVHSWIISVNQDPLGEQARCVQGCNSYTEGIQIWRCRIEAEQETHAVAIVNVGSKTVYSPVINFKAIGLNWDIWHIADMVAQYNQGIRKKQYLMVQIQTHQTFLY